ncbi:MAG: putative membrane protein/domain protein [uncultured archaeon A07HB70]|nr:MAG: putative membrane protein/domain protein [uncultured archaeon A07HB70]
MSTGANDTDVLPKRIAAELVDIVISQVAGLLLFLIIVVLGGGASALTGGPGGGGLAAGLGVVAVLAGALVLAGTNFGYSVGLEYANDGQTVGKLLLGIRVAAEDGSEPDLLSVVIRNVPAIAVGIVGAVFFLLLIVFYPIILAVGLVVIVVSDEEQRLFDIAAQTVVVEA